MSKMVKLDMSIIDYQPETDQDFITKCLASKLWRMNNLYKVANKLGAVVTFRMNGPQIKVASCRHNRKVVLKSRQVGISTYHLIYNLDETLFNATQTNGVMAQGLDEADELLEKCRLAWRELDPKVKEFLQIKNIIDNSKEFAFSNGSKLLIRTSFRSGTLQNLHVSELGKISAKAPEKAKELKTGTFQAIGGKRRVTVESTAEGKFGLFFEIWTDAENHQGDWSELDFYPIFISWVEDDDCQLDTPQRVTKAMNKYFKSLEQIIGITLTDKQKNFYIKKKEELKEDMTQEYPSTPEEAFQATRDGAYYGNQMRQIRKLDRVVTDLYDPNLKVHVAMDLGMNDDFTMVFFQYYRGEVRFIDEYSNNGEAIAHYVNILKAKKYSYGSVYGPHDLRVRELGTGKSRRDIFRSLGVNIRICKNIAINDGIETVRAMLANTWIDHNCEQIIESLDNYTKEWDEKRGSWKDKPVHNKYSHMADAVRYAALTNIIGDMTVDSRSFEANSGSGYVPTPGGIDL